MQLFDAHTHIDMENFQYDRDRVIQRAKETGLIGIVTSSIGPASFRRTLGIIEKHKNYVFHSAGCSVSQLTPDETRRIIELTKKYSQGIVAIGEVGLDYHWVKDMPGRKAQEPLLLQFIDLAKELELPIVIHSRKAEEQAAVILEKESVGDVLMHCFDGPLEVAQRVADNGWYITLPANFARSKNRVQAARILPLKQIMLETDGPYLSPTSERNEPANIKFGCENLAAILGQPADYIGEITTQNSKRFYRL